MLKSIQRQLPRGIAAVYFGGSIDLALVNSRLAPARRRAALRILGQRPFKAFLAVTLADVAA